MIPCQACGNDNPMATRFCRRCGTRLEVAPEQVLGSVQRDQAALVAERWFERGSSLLAISLFFLTCALILRYSLVPPMPAVEVPPVEIGGFLPPAAPAVKSP